jgi:ribosomal protein L11 methyltransferase
VRDFLLDIEFAPQAEEEVRGLLYLSRSTGDVSTDRGITAWFDSPEDRDAAAQALQLLAVTVQPREQDRQDWLELYRQTLQSMEIGRRFVVAPDAALITSPGRIPIVIPQERAFGTGSHESTALCLEMLEDLPLDGRVGIDVGTGSGILAIGMLALGAARVFAFDNDPEITGVIHRNMERNGIDHRSLLAFVGTDETVRGLTADVITMNILPEVIVPLLPVVGGWLRPGGSVVLSGVLCERAPEVIDAAMAVGLKPESQLERGEWWCGLVRK